MSDDPLLAELYARPDDPAPYAVYADVLQLRGDPRGELIALQAAGHNATAYLAAHPALDLPKPRRTMPFPPDLELSPDTVEWFCGFVKSLSAFRMLNADVEALLAHPSSRLLREVSISGTGQVDGSTCEMVARYQARTLESLAVSVNAASIFDNAYRALAPCTRLRHLHLTGDYDDAATIDAIRALRAFPRLESFTLPVTLTDAVCAELVGVALNTLFVNAVSEHRLTTAGTAALAKLPLEQLGADGTLCGTIAPLAGHPSLRRLELMWTMDPTPFTLEVAAIVATLPALHTLELNGATIDDDGVAALAPLAPHMRSLDLSNTRITAAACETIAEMRGLDRLCLANASAAGLRALAPLGELECLWLGMSNAIDDAAVRALRAFPKLARLSLGGPNAITDACVADLAAMPELHLLNLTRTAITPAGIDRLAAGAPKLRTLFVNACDPATIARAKQIERWTVSDSLDGFDDQRDV